MTLSLNKIRYNAKQSDRDRSIRIQKSNVNIQRNNGNIDTKGQGYKEYNDTIKSLMIDITTS